MNNEQALVLLLDPNRRKSASSVPLLHPSPVLIAGDHNNQLHEYTLAGHGVHLISKNPNPQAGCLSVTLASIQHTRTNSTHPLGLIVIIADSTLPYPFFSMILSSIIIQLSVRPSRHRRHHILVRPAKALNNTQLLVFVVSYHSSSASFLIVQIGTLNQSINQSLVSYQHPEPSFSSFLSIGFILLFFLSKFWAFLKFIWHVVMS